MAQSQPDILAQKVGGNPEQPSNGGAPATQPQPNQNTSGGNAAGGATTGATPQNILAALADFQKGTATTAGFDGSDGGAFGSAGKSQAADVVDGVVTSQPQNAGGNGAAGGPPQQPGASQ